MKYIKKVILLYTLAHLCSGVIDISAMKQYSDEEIMQIFDNFLSSFKPDVLIVSQKLSPKQEESKNFAIALKEFKEKNSIKHAI